jgi:hypothetical protein
MGRTKGKARMDMRVELLLSVAEITETNVKTTAIPKIPAREPMIKSEISLTGNPEKIPKKIRIERKIRHKKTKL